MNTEKSTAEENSKALKFYKTRSAAKLRYAEIHLREVEDFPDRGRGLEFERAHFESFFFHLFGARDCYLQECNAFYGCGLPEDKVDLKALTAWSRTEVARCRDLELIAHLVRETTFRTEGPADAPEEALTWRVELETDDRAARPHTLVFEPVEGRLLSVVRR